MKLNFINNDAVLCSLNLKMSYLQVGPASSSYNNPVDSNPNFDLVVLATQWKICSTVPEGTIL